MGLSETGPPPNSPLVHIMGLSINGPPPELGDYSDHCLIISNLKYIVQIKLEHSSKFSASLRNISFLCSSV